MIRRLIDIFLQEWMGTLQTKNRYEPYRTFKTVFCTESYISDIDVYCFRVAFVQFRLGVLPINNNMHRYSESPVSRNCPLCTNATENDHHFLLVCPFYSDLRARFVVNSPDVYLSVPVVLSWKDVCQCQNFCSMLLREESCIYNLGQVNSFYILHPMITSDLQLGCMDSSAFTF